MIFNHTIMINSYKCAVYFVTILLVLLGVFGCIYDLACVARSVWMYWQIMCIVAEQVLV